MFIYDKKNMPNELTGGNGFIELKIIYLQLIFLNNY